MQHQLIRHIKLVLSSSVTQWPYTLHPEIFRNIIKFYLHATDGHSNALPPHQNTKPLFCCHDTIPHKSFIIAALFPQRWRITDASIHNIAGPDVGIQVEKATDKALCFTSEKSETSKMTNRWINKEDWSNNNI